MDTNISTIQGTESSPLERRLAPRKEVRIKIVLNDQVNMNMAATLDLSESGALIAAGVNLQPGTAITIFPLLDDMAADLFELKGKVVRSYEDILVPAYCDERFRMGISLDLNPKQREALKKYIETVQ